MKINRKISRIVGSGILVLLVMSLLTSMVVGTFNDKDGQINKSQISETVFFAEVEFTLFQGDGCGCFPLADTLVFAAGLDTDHNASAYTDEEGFVMLELEIDSSYRITIEHDDYNNVLFDFIVVDDQYFSFHMEETVESVLQDLAAPSYQVRELEPYTRLVK